MRVIYSWGSSDELAYHGSQQRGSASVILLNHNTEQPATPDDAWTWDALIDNVRLNINR